MQYLIPPWNIEAPPGNIAYLHGICKQLRGIFDTSVECLSASVENFIPPWNVSYLGGIFDTSVEYLTTSVEYFIPLVDTTAEHLSNSFIPPWNI